MNNESKRISLAGFPALALVLCVSLPCAPAALANDESAKETAHAACAACHGPDGNKPVTPETPRLGGQQYDYLIQALNEYRTGARDNAVMSAMAKPLTQQEIRKHAAYFSSQQGLTTKR